MFKASIYLPDGAAPPSHQRRTPMKPRDTDRRSKFLDDGSGGFSCHVKLRRVSFLHCHTRLGRFSALDTAVLPWTWPPTCSSTVRCVRRIRTSTNFQRPWCRFRWNSESCAHFPWPNSRGCGAGCLGSSVAWKGNSTPVTGDTAKLLSHHAPICFVLVEKYGHLPCWSQVLTIPLSTLDDGGLVERKTPHR